MQRLLKQMQVGEGTVETDASATSDLYERYGRWLKAALTRRFGVEAAEDLVQETYARLLRYPSSRVFEHPRALLLRIATNLVRDEVRKRKGAKFVPMTAARQAEWDKPAHADQFEGLLLKQIVLSLPKPFRDVFVLSRFVGLSNDEIARRLGLSVKTVEWRMSKAIALCARGLRGQGGH